VSALVNGRLASAPVTIAGDAYLPLAAPLKAGDCVTIQGGPPSPEVCIGEPSDFGRVRYYFTGGAMASKDREEFSKTDLFISFSLDKNYLLSERGRVRLNSYFDIKLTAIPVAERPATDLDSFLASKKAAALAVGFYLPITTTQWRNPGADYSLFVAPLAKVGFLTPTDTSDTAIVNPNKFFTVYGLGARLGHFREFRDDNGRAPELLSSIDFVVGRFGNFETYRDETPILQAEHLVAESYTTPGYVRKRLSRLEVEGMLIIPGTPFLVGFNANIGLARQHEPGFSLVRDDLRFLFGARFDARRLMQKFSGLN